MDALGEFTPLFSYMPHDKQFQIHNSPAKLRAYIGGNRSGKTYCGSMETLWWAYGIHPFIETPEPPVRVRICGPSYNVVIEEVILPMLQTLMPSSTYTYWREKRQIEFQNGSVISLLSYDQDVQKYGGTSLHFVWMDEEPPERMFVENMMRLVDTGGSAMMTFTPIEGLSWSYDRVLLQDQKKDDEGRLLVETVTGSTYDNPHVSKREIDTIKLMVSDPDELEARLFGKFFSHTGMVFKFFDPDVNVVEPFEIPWGWTIMAGYDFHPKTQQAVVFIAIDPATGDYYVFDEIYDYLLIDEVADEINDVLGARRLNLGVIDHNAAIESSMVGISPQTQLARSGLHFLPAAKGKDSVKHGIHTLNELFRDRKLFIFENCNTLIRQVQTYLWDTWRGKQADRKGPKEQPIKKDDHLIDALRFVVHGRPRPRKSVDQMISSPEERVREAARRHRREILFERTGY